MNSYLSIYLEGSAPETLAKKKSNKAGLGIFLRAFPAAWGNGSRKAQLSGVAIYLRESWQRFTHATDGRKKTARREGGVDGRGKAVTTELSQHTRSAAASRWRQAWASKPHSGQKSAAIALTGSKRWVRRATVFDSPTGCPGGSETEGRAEGDGGLRFYMGLLRWKEGDGGWLFFTLYRSQFYGEIFLKSLVQVKQYSSERS